MTQTRTSPTKHTYEPRDPPLFKNDFCSLTEWSGTFEKFDNTMSDPSPLIVFERGDAVAALLYDPAYHEVILVEQFRLPTIRKGQGGGWMLELAAGIPKANETNHGSLVREILEETGYQVNQFVPIANFFPSPGATTEKIFLFYAEVRRAQKKEMGGGVPRDNENIRIVTMPLKEFFAKLRSREFEDAKLIIAAQWLKDRLATLPVFNSDVSAPVERILNLPHSRTAFGRRGAKPRKIVGYIKGSIEKVHGMDAWVNPLTSDMLLDRYSDRTISAVIRNHGAQKYPDGRIEIDVIGNALRKAMGPRHFIDPGNVIVTESGELRKNNGVRQIFHVATMDPASDPSQRVNLKTLDHCLIKVLSEIERHGHRSCLVPIIGTGHGGLLVNEVAPSLLNRAITFFRDRPKAQLRKIYFLAYSDIDAEVLADAFENCNIEFEPIENKTYPGKAAS